MKCSPSVHRTNTAFGLLIAVCMLTSVMGASAQPAELLLRVADSVFAGETLEVSAVVNDGSGVEAARLAVDWDAELFAFDEGSFAAGGACGNYVLNPSKGSLVVSMGCVGSAGTGEQTLASWRLHVPETAGCPREATLAWNTTITRLNDGELPLTMRDATTRIVCPPDPDLDGSGRVDYRDLIILMRQWQRTVGE